MTLYDFPCPYRDICEFGRQCDRRGAEVITCEKYLEYVRRERKKVDTILCVLKERAYGYSILEISRFCECSTHTVSKILKEYGDPLKKKGE